MKFVLSDTDEENVRCDAMMQSKSVLYLLGLMKCRCEVQMCWFKRCG